MTTEFSHRSLHGAKAGRRRMLIATLCVALLFSADFLSHGAVRSFARLTAAGAWSVTRSVRDTVFNTGYFTSHRTLAQENAALRAAVARLEEQTVAYRAVSQENTELRAMLQLAQGQGGIVAPIVSSFRSSPYGTFLIGRGTGDPVAVGDAVLTEGGFLLGIVSDVQLRTSAVRGIFASGESTDARIGATAVVLEGDGGGRAHASVPRGIVVREGDPVIATAYGGRPVGIVGHIESSPTSADQTVYVQVPVNLTQLRFVFIVHE